MKSTTLKSSIKKFYRPILGCSLLVIAATFGWVTHADIPGSGQWLINANGSEGVLTIDSNCQSGAITFFGMNEERLSNLVCYRNNYGQMMIRFERPISRQTYSAEVQGMSLRGQFLSSGASYNFSGFQTYTDTTCSSDYEINANGSEGMLSIDYQYPAQSLKAKIHFFGNSSSADETLDQVYCLTSAQDHQTFLKFRRPLVNQWYSANLTGDHYSHSRILSGNFRSNGSTYNFTGNEVTLSDLLIGEWYINANGSEGRLKLLGNQRQDNTIHFFGNHSPETLSSVYIYQVGQSGETKVRFLRPLSSQAYVGSILNQANQTIQGTFTSNGGRYSWSASFLGQGGYQPPHPIPQPIPQPIPTQPPTPPVFNQEVSVDTGNISTMVSGLTQLSLRTFVPDFNRMTGAYIQRVEVTASAVRNPGTVQVCALNSCSNRTMINVGPAQTVSLEISGQNILGRDFQDIGLTIQGQMRINRVRVVGYLPSSIQPPQANLRSVRTPDLYQSINDRTGINLSQLFDLNYFGQVQTQAIQFEVERGSTYSSISFCNIIAESNGSSTHYREQCSPPQYAGEERRVIEIPINARLNSL